MYFKRFNLDILQGIDPNIPYTTEKVLDNVANIISYYPLIDNVLKEQLRNRFPIPPDQISMSLCGTEIPPHRDHKPHSVCMNYYIDTANGATHFYEKKTPEEMALLGDLGPWGRPFTINHRTAPAMRAGEQMSQEEDNNIFWKIALNRVASFKANTNEYWLLNVKKIHSVTFDTPKVTPPRKFLVFAWWTKEFDEIAEMLEQMSIDNSAHT
jgi:hypothetical protein